MFLLNLILAIAWVALTGEFTPTNFFVGFILVYVTLRLTQQTADTQRYLRRVRVFISFIFFFLWELLVASVRVAGWVLKPRLDMKPAVVRVPLDVTRDVEITLLANLITLTPGTLSLDVSPDKKSLFVHVFDVEDRDHFVRGIKHGFEQRVKEVMQ